MNTRAVRRQSGLRLNVPQVPLDMQRRNRPVGWLRDSLRRHPRTGIEEDTAGLVAP